MKYVAIIKLSSYILKCECPIYFEKIVFYIDILSRKCHDCKCTTQSV